MMSNKCIGGQTTGTGEATEVISRDGRAGHPVILSVRETESIHSNLPYYGDSIVDCGWFADAGLEGGYAGQDAVSAVLGGGQCGEPC